MAERKLKFTIDVDTTSETNARGHWGKKSRRAKAQREFAKLCTISKLDRKLVGFVPKSIKLVRVYPSNKPLDQGNLAAAMKAVQDGICDALGVDDGHPDIKWIYDQDKPKQVRVEIEWSES